MQTEMMGSVPPPRPTAQLSSIRTLLQLSSIRTLLQLSSIRTSTREI